MFVPLSSSLSLVEMNNLDRRLTSELQSIDISPTMTNSGQKYEDLLAQPSRNYNRKKLLHSHQLVPKSKLSNR